VSAKPRLVFATGNEHKLREVAAILREVVEVTDDAVASSGIVGGPEVVETGVTFAENALLKARALAAHAGLPAIADDSGLCVQAMGGAPGVFSARWAGSHGDSKANIALLLDQLADIPDGQRGAWFECAAVLVTPGGEEFVEVGRLTGTLTREPRGLGGFGYDPILVPTGGKSTCAELDAGAKNAISHRGRAFRALAPRIAQFL
jgi:XTP/dITP diphosphohydrolase